MNTNQEFHRQDVEMFAMVNEKTAARRKRREALELACIEQAEIPQTQRSMSLQTVAGSAVRGGIGLMVVGGITRGLVDPGFGFVLAAMCAAWALIYCRRHCYGNH